MDDDEQRSEPGHEPENSGSDSEEEHETRGVGDLVVPVCERRVFDLASLTAGAGELIIAHAIPVPAGADARLSVRVHDIRNGAGIQFNVVVRGISPTDEGGADFALGSDLAATDTFCERAARRPSLLQLFALIWDTKQPQLQVVLRWTGHGFSRDLTLILTLSAELVVLSK